MLGSTCRQAQHLLLTMLLLTAFTVACANQANAKGADNYSTPVEKKLAKSEYGLHFVFKPRPKSKTVRVEIHLSKTHLVRSISFKHDRARHLNFSAEGKVKRFKSSVRWTPRSHTDVLSYEVKVRHKRNELGYDAYIGAEWAIFRGEDIVPAAKVRSRKGAYSYSTLEIDLPPKWSGMDTGWPRGRGKFFRVNNAERKFDRPTGWMIAGNIGSRRDFLEDTQISIAAPQGGAVQRMNALALINMVWPAAKNAFQILPEKILVVGADDPMWRGGLSAPNSFYVHADRPLVSENGTSTLLHELTHVITRIRGGSQSDWIPEGLAEFYSIELMRRAGAMNQTRYELVIDKLSRWSADVRSLRTGTSSGQTTARAVLLLQQLDREIQESTQGAHNIDDVTRKLMKRRYVTNKRLRTVVEQLLGKPSKTLKSALLK